MRLLCFLLLPFFAPAQPGPVKAPGGVWNAAIEQDWVVDMPLDTEQDSGILTLKLLYDEAQNHYIPGHSLEELALWAAAAEKFDFFKDPACTVPMTWMEVLGYPAPYIDPETGEEKMLIGCTDFNVRGVVKAWRLRQTVTGDTRTDTWKTKVQAMAPLMEDRNEDGDSIGLKPMFWFRPVDTRPDMGSDYIVWVKKTANRQEKTRIPLISFQSPRAGQPGSYLRAHFQDVLENRLNTPLFDADNAVLLSPEVRRSLLHRTDTVLNCFPAPDDSTQMFIVESNLMEYVHHLGLWQTWYWNARQQRLHICLDAVAPLEEILNDEGEFRFFKPLFIRRTNQ